jgi:NAD(P)-dependent dehydrogenase (short-subunit alcohol dehydrogenase family)
MKKLVLLLIAGALVSPAFAEPRTADSTESSANAQEVAPLGIKVLLVEPGPFRTDWAGRSAAESPETIADYRDTAGAGVKTFRARNGRQPGDPARAAAAIIQAVEAANPPRRLLLGKFALAAARRKVAVLQEDFEGWAEVTEGADFPRD